MTLTAHPCFAQHKHIVPVSSCGHVMYWGPKTSTDVAKCTACRQCRILLQEFLTAYFADNKALSAQITFYSIQVHIGLGRSVMRDRNDGSWKWKSLESNYLYFSRYTWPKAPIVITRLSLAQVLHICSWMLTGHTLYQTRDVWRQEIRGHHECIQHGIEAGVSAKHMRTLRHTHLCY